MSCCLESVSRCLQVSRLAVCFFFKVSCCLCEFCCLNNHVMLVRDGLAVFYVLLLSCCLEYVVLARDSLAVFNVLSCLCCCRVRRIVLLS